MVDCIPSFITTEDSTGQPIELCNVFDQWTRRELILSDTEEIVSIEDEQIFLVYPTLKRMSQGDSWQLILELNDGQTIVSPTVIFWQNPDGSRTFNFSLNAGQKLYLEFFYIPAEDKTLQSASLILEEVPDLALANQIDETAISGKISQIDQWLAFYTHNSEPFAINSEYVVHSATGSEIEIPDNSANAIDQLHLVQASILAYWVSNIFSHRQRALNLADAVINYFYRNTPLSIDTAWYPHNLINAGNAFTSQGAIAPDPKHYGYFDQVVEFVDGIGQLPENQLARVYKVYQGQLSDRRVDAPLIQGRSYAIESWVDIDGVTVEAPEEPEESIELEGNVIYGYAYDIRIIPAYSAYIFGAFF